MVRDAQIINQAFGYEMNTIEFAVENGIPYAIDFLNPAPDFERDRITEFYFKEVVQRMAKLVSIARCAAIPRTRGLDGANARIGKPAGFIGSPSATQAGAKSA